LKKRKILERSMYKYQIFKTIYYIDTFDFANPFPLSSGEEGLLAALQCVLLENTN